MDNAEFNNPDFIDFCNGQLSPVGDPLEFSDFLNFRNRSRIDPNNDNISDRSSQYRSPALRQRMENYVDMIDQITPNYSKRLASEYYNPPLASEYEEPISPMKQPQLLNERDLNCEEKINSSQKKGSYKSASAEKRVITVVSRPDKKQSCNCRKTNCLKLYCDCLAQGKFCGEDCYCEDCKNNSQYVEIKDVAYSTYKKTMKNMGEEGVSNVVRQSGLAKSPVLKSNKGCNCKKSGCEKKYCECFAMGVECGRDCHCVGCNNKIRKYGSGRKSRPSNANLVKGSNIRKMEEVGSRRISKAQGIRSMKGRLMQEDGENVYLTPRKSGK